MPCTVGIAFESCNFTAPYATTFNRTPSCSCKLAMILNRFAAVELALGPKIRCGVFRWMPVFSADAASKLKQPVEIPSAVYNPEYENVLAFDVVHNHVLAHGKASYPVPKSRVRARPT